MELNERNCCKRETSERTIECEGKDEGKLMQTPALLSILGATPWRRLIDREPSHFIRSS
jgi:hypothetical protein